MWYAMKSVLLSWVCVLGLTASLVTHAQDIEPTGYLMSSGGYFSRPHGSTVSLLPNADLFVYGNGASPNEWRDYKEQVDALSARRGVSNKPDAKPKLYDSQRRGWVRLPPAPECTGDHYLHTATVLPEGEVLIAGGLCDMPKMLGDSPLQELHVALSLWDPVSRQWKPGQKLAQARIFHSATLMVDGSVFFTGGESDPAWAQGIDNPVLASVERYLSGQVRTVPPMHTARAKHSATALPDNRLLVVGGLSTGGRPITSAEVFDARTHEWQTLPPLHTARHSHTATLLADGRVLVTGGVGEDGRPLRSVELWDPVTNNWTEGSPLPLGLYGHAAAQLASGEVFVAGGGWVSAQVPGQLVPWAWSWNPQSDTWQLAGRTSPANETVMSSPVTLTPQPDGSVLIFTPSEVLRWRAGSVPNAGAPTWGSAPALVKLPQGRLMTIGHAPGDSGMGAPVAHIWDAATDRWSSAGVLEPAGSSWDEHKAVALPSGRVIYARVGQHNVLYCQVWDSSSNGWSSCGSVRLRHLAQGLQLGVLSDGRAFALTHQQEAAVFDEKDDHWARWRVNWLTHDSVYGAPIRREQPLAVITDPATDRSFEVNDAGTRFFGRTSDGSLSMWRNAHWNAQAGWWDYVLEKGMGANANARRLPDACIISTHPVFALFRPQDARIISLPDPGIGHSRHSMLVMDDGTVVAAYRGNASLEPGSGFFHRKASCAGFAPAPTDDQYISQTLVVDPVPPVADPPAPPVLPSAPWWQPWWEAVVQYKWALLVFLGACVSYLLLRRLSLPRMPGSRTFKILIRVIVYGIFTFFLLLFGIPAINIVRGIPMEKWDRTKGVVWQKSHKKTVTPADLPCNLIGEWFSTHGNVMRRIELKADGRYSVAPNQMTIRGGPWRTPTGKWWVQGDAIFFQGDTYGTADKSTMRDVTERRFQVINEKGLYRTNTFELIEAKPPPRCKKP